MSIVSKARTLGAISFQPLTGSSRTISRLFFSAVAPTDVNQDGWLEPKLWGPTLTALLLSGWLFLTGSIFDLFFDRVWWSQWRQQLGQVRVGHALLASAVKHRVLSLQQQVSAAESGLVSSVHIFSPYTHRGGVGLPSRRLAIMRLPLSWALPAVKGAGQGAEGRSNREGWPQWREAAITNMVNVITSGLHSASANPGAGKGFMN